jgi:hypothetical protein
MVSKEGVWTLTLGILLLGGVLVGGSLLRGGEEQPPSIAALSTPTSAFPAEAPSPTSAPSPTATVTPPAAVTAAQSVTTAPDVPTATAPNQAPTPPPPTEPIPSPTAAPAPTIPFATGAEAEQTVRAYFAAIDADSPDAARNLTSGVARRQTDEAVQEIQDRADAEGVTLDLRVPELNVTALPPEGAATPVHADSLIQAYADTLLGQVLAEEVRSSATFLVERTPEGIRIVEIRGDLLGGGE